MHALVIAKGITLQELGHQGHDGNIAAPGVEGFTVGEALSKLGWQGNDGAIDSIVAEGFTG